MNTELYFIRHGQPVLQNALLGKTDSPLSELGWSQLKQSFSAVDDIDCVVSSSLSRCASFAQYISEKNNYPLEISDEWRECQFGDWDGQTYVELHRQFPEDTSQFFSQPAEFTPPNGEPL